MPVIAVVNRKGGSGKTTLSAHLAAWCAQRGAAVMLGDVDRQQSSRGWLRRRPASAAPVQPWARDAGNMLRMPAGVTHVVLDTPGGMHGFELARVVMAADVLLLPVGPSLLEREAAADCHAELMALPRVASGRCRLAALGMRVDGRTRAHDTLRDWAATAGLTWLGHLRDTQAYARCMEHGLTLFDLPPSRVATDLAQWKPVLDWLEPLLWPSATRGDAMIGAGHAASPTAARPGARSASLMPAQNMLLPGGRLVRTTATHPQDFAGVRPALPSRAPGSPATPLLVR